MQEDGFVFISYSRKNKEVVEEIIKKLESNGIEVFVDYRDIPPGAVFAERIVSAIESCPCCLLIYTVDANASGYVLSEMNCAVNHNKIIIPIRLDQTTPTKGIEFYIGKNNWFDYYESSFDLLVQSIKSIKPRKKEAQKVLYDKPTVLNQAQVRELGYSSEKIVVETIEIDYRTLGDAPCEYSLTEETEGTIDDWIDYVNTYPATALFLVAKDRIVGYCQIELISRENYSAVISGEKMIDSGMQEFYGFGGDFCCYIVVMPILKEYENQNNYMMLFDAFIRHMVSFSEEGIYITEYGISVYTPMLEKMMGTIGFCEVGTNPVGGKIMELSADAIRSSSIFPRRYPEFYGLYNKGE